MKTTITKKERLQLQGLISLGQAWSQKAEDVYNAACELMGEKPNEERGFISDVIYDGNNKDVDHLLKQLGVKVK